MTGVLVTGGAGFIGSNLVDALVEQGHKVIVVDNLSTGLAKNVHSRAKFYEMNIVKPRLAAVFEKERPEIVYHQAAQMVIQKSVDDPIFDAEQNILGSLNLILQCLLSGVRKIVYASSGGAVYGEPKYRPVDEDHPVNPISQYGASKHAVEHYLEIYGKQRGLEYVVLRYANVYGPRQVPQGESGVVAVFMKQMLNGERPTIFGAGNKTRDYIHVSDVVAANIVAMAKGKNTIYNIGTGVETTDREMFDAIARLVGYRGGPHYAPVRRSEIRNTCLQCSKARKELGWQPRLSLEEGLSLTYASVTRPAESDKTR